MPKSHLFFTGGKDKKIKQWDADNFEHIMTLEGHHAEVWSLCISSSGNILASASHDKSLRLWEKTEEILVLDEEKEMVCHQENMSMKSIHFYIEKVEYAGVNLFFLPRRF